jgi:hypothetical protein
MWGRNLLAKSRSSASVVLIGVALAAAGGAAGCESNSVPPIPYSIVSRYLSQIAEGSYQGACALLDPQARSSLIRAKHTRLSCPDLFSRCLPNRVINANHDQSQLLYATILVTEGPRKAHVAVSGTAVARAIREVTLAKKRGNWKLTSYGHDLEICSLRRHRSKAAAHSPRAAVGSKARRLTA